MKKKITSVDAKGNYIQKEMTYIPFRYILAILLTVLETLAVIAILVVLAKFVPYFYLAILLTEILVVLNIINSDDNPDYKIPWLLLVLLVPVAGFMIYFMYYSRELPKKFRKKLAEIQDIPMKNDASEFAGLKTEDVLAYHQAQQLCKTADTHLYQNTQMTYFDVGEKMYESMLDDLRQAEKFIFLEFFIIEEGVFWDSILEILKEKCRQSVEVKVVYDDIGCMMTLPGNYDKELSKYGISAVPFARLRGQANNEFNNRSHRKIMVIDGKIGYTGGVNIADEYINQKVRFGHWKDTGIRLCGEAVSELTKMFLIDYAMNVKHAVNAEEYLFPYQCENGGYVIPFGSGPRPMYEKEVGKSVILNLLNQAKEYVYITTPYLIIDNELCQAIENAAIRGIDVKIITPHIPDKKLIFGMTRSSYQRFLDNGVEIYEYEPGFIHAKMYISDDAFAMIGTINLDYRSLVHHFENGVWMYRCNAITDMKRDFLETMDQSMKIEKNTLNDNFLKRFIRAVVRIFAPLL